MFAPGREKTRFPYRQEARMGEAKRRKAWRDKTGQDWGLKGYKSPGRKTIAADQQVLERPIPIPHNGQTP
jgi:hypothetical protein